LPNAYGVGTDISEAALRTARTNAVHLGLADRSGFVACHYAAALADRFDLIVSNPPYIRSAEIAELATEVRDHDPLDALDGGEDGLDAYRAIVPQAAALISEGGALVMEVGYDQSEHVQQMMRAAGLTMDIPPKADLAGIGRAVAGRKLPP
jgi:release factor glutamine methyltransferase